MEQLLSIGEFAERCGLSRSALRFYDQNGLLAPRLVDSETGYRHYAVGQLEQAALVRRLRSAELPVAALREFLAAPPARRRVILEQHSASFRQRVDAVESAVGRLREDLDRAERLRGGAERWCAVAPGVFAEGLSQVSFAVADPAVRADLGAVWIETKEGSLRLVATDSYRMAVRDLPPDRLGSAGIRGVIGAGHARTMVSELAVAAALVLSQDEAGVISALVDGRETVVGGDGEGFPDYERLISELPVGHRIVLARAELERALNGLTAGVAGVAGVGAAGAAEAAGAAGAAEISLTFDADGLGLATSAEQVSVAGSWSGPALTVVLNSQFLADAVRATVGPDVLIEAADPLAPIVLRSADTGTFSVLTMPIRAPDRA